jgi:ribosome biogenesis GTPase A
MKQMQDDGYHVITYSALTNENIRHLMKTIQEISPPKFKTVGTWMLIAGLPNVGKSSVINSLRKWSK